MHSLLIVGVIAIAVGLRWRWQPVGPTWRVRWNRALAAFCLPPLLLLSASAAVLSMGHHGLMMGMPVSPLGCWAGQGFWVLGLGVFLFSLGKNLWFRVRLRQYPSLQLPSGESVRCLESDTPFAAQVGFWQSQILVSRGWLQALTPQEQQAILRHEQAHAYYRDPVWFFWLGMVRRLTLWLPCTDALWQDLLLLREIRADQWAVRESDPLLLAELLVKLTHCAADGISHPQDSIAFCHGESIERLEQRIEALINPDYFMGDVPRRGEWVWLVFAVTPFLATWLHHST